MESHEESLGEITPETPAIPAPLSSVTEPTSAHGIRI